MPEHLLYDGTWLSWLTDQVGPPLAFPATSGMPGHQITADQCLKDKGPIPEGRYSLLLKIDPHGYARHSGRDDCTLYPSSLIQKIPRGGGVGMPSRTQANFCESYWANWGVNRVRVEPANATTRDACSPRRSGFYLHDSTKGYSHGCIEVAPRFFDHLRTYVKHTRKKRLTLVVKYASSSTRGDTLRIQATASP